MLVISLCETTSSNVTGLYFSTLKMSDGFKADFADSHHGNDSASESVSAALLLPLDSVGRESDMRTSSSESILHVEIDASQRVTKLRRVLCNRSNDQTLSTGTHRPSTNG